MGMVPDHFKGSPESADGYQETRKAAAVGVTGVKLGCGSSLERPWRRPFSWPQGSPGRPFVGSGRESRAWPRLCSESVSRERDVWNTLFSLLSPQPDPG